MSNWLFSEGSMTRKTPYTDAEIEGMIDCLLNNNLLDSNATDDITWLITGLLRREGMIE
jgi:hypothetical protein